MSELVFVDTIVLIYGRDDRDGRKRDRATDWLTRLAETDRLRLNLQVVNERTRWMLANEKTRQLDAIRDEIELLHQWGDDPVGSDDVEIAWTVRQRHGFQWFDCLLVASAARLGCRYFLTEDMASGSRFGDLVLVDPFLTAPSDLLTQH